MRDETGGEQGIEVLNVSKYYGALPAVRDVSFTARRGEVPNGLSRLRGRRVSSSGTPPSIVVDPATPRASCTTAPPINALIFYMSICYM